MDGLIIKKKWLDLILDGKKRLEIRGSDTKKQGEEIYLLESGTRKVRAKCVIESTFPISCSDWTKERACHCVDCSYADLQKRYRRPYAWVLSNVKPLDGNFHYIHPQGAVIWVRSVELKEA